MFTIYLISWILIGIISFSILMIGDSLRRKQDIYLSDVFFCVTMGSIAGPIATVILIMIAYAEYAHPTVARICEKLGNTKVVSVDRLSQ